MKLATVLIFLFCAVSGCSGQNATPHPAEIDSFEECASAGYPITRSVPARCIVNGKSFEDTVVQPEIPPLPGNGLPGNGLPGNGLPGNGTDRACKDTCGNGTCEEIVCMAIGCPCPESKATCPTDCP